MAMPKGAGVVQGRLNMKPFIPKTSMKNLVIQILAMGAKMKGMKKMGFKTMGAPKRNGSLTPKQTGTAEARPTARISLDLARKANMKQITNVAPVPPMATTKS